MNLKIPFNKGKQKHKSIKIKLKTILTNSNKFYDVINNNVIKINQIIIYAYQFLRLLVLDKYDDNMNIDRQFIYNILKTICENNFIKYEETDKYKIIFEYYNENYKKFKFDDIDSKNTSFILQYSSIEMNTCIENNIMNHFKDYLNKYINVLFLYDEKKKISEIKDDSERKIKTKELYADIKNMKLDLYTNSTLIKYNGKHKKWLNNNRKKLVPNLEKDNINYSLKKNPLKFMKYAIYINKEIENNKIRPYQIIPQRNSIVPKHITLDHSAVVDILGNVLLDKIKKTSEEHKKSYITLHPKEYQQRVFETLFNFNHKIFKQGKYIFNYQFKTDGISAVLDFVNYRKDKYQKKEKKEKKEIRINEVKKKTKKEFLKKSKNNDNLPDLEKLTNKEIKEINDNYKVVAVDPGKKSLLTMVDEEGNVFQYNSVERRHKTYHKFAHLIIEKEKTKNKIQKIEEKFCNNSHRTLNKKDFLKGIINKNSINKKLEKFYHKPLFRNIKFRVYCRTKQEEANLLNRIQTFYTKRLTKRQIKRGIKKEDQKKLLIAYGNWSRTTQMKGFFPTPCKGIRDLVASKFKMVIVDEFKTSCICNKTETEMKKWKYLINNKLKECHKVLTSIKSTNPQGEATERIFIDRDINGAKNILKIAKSWLTKKIRPKIFCRNT